MKSIKYQHGGLPHAHIVVQLSNMPDKYDAAGQIEWIKKHIHTYAPREGSIHFTPNRRELVRQHMLHKCSHASNGCLKNGR